MITIVTCWYVLKCKFDKKTYEYWFSNFLSNVNKNGKIPAINIFQALESINFAFGKTKVNF